MRLLALEIVLAATCNRAVLPLPTASPLAYAPLAWDLGEDANLARLDAANMAPRADVQRGYFTDPDQGHAAPGTISVAHTTEPVLIFTPRPGWHGVAHYPTPGGALDRIELTGALTFDAARAALDDLEHRHGPPTDRRELPSGDATIPPTLRLIWVRDGIWLVAFAGADGQLAIHYRRDRRPASDIGP